MWSRPLGEDGRDENDVVSSKEGQKCSGLQMLEKAMNRVSPEPSGGMWPNCHRGLRLLVSRPVGEYISTVLSHKLVVICPSNPRK